MKPFFAYPADGEVFKLTLNGDASDNQPLAMVHTDGYTGKWKHNGRVVKGAQTCRFKLVAIGYCRDFEEVKRKLAPHGKIPEGQWRQAFKASYRKPDGKGQIGVADSSWSDPDGNAAFPCVHGYGRSGFDWVGSAFSGGWHWLVAVSE
ncbi:hypothetical protein A3B21_01935 [Candidatus Uhrbacteria bacterium RIFCSPLOWO2_01_FULL_47_24]|uniref:Uncharacterized protein n=1 Tax=Candidatus Uhrbacteria bacterium RIFCSPLOWO2_01_FULL_47_24 TaxID=1802401 RepID=A0A1F7UPF1_9BACT|nr:MAG: hypothetical protein A2753_01685 [Candidatus Uhrbacteria bacterium RIFCSPHIGHO2_01_FULL_47_11]OGL67929.1 MAG: hypothetical protein A3D58_05130 [Candidatus Uhrbacteria bacterium RIFCSPHIGHO2_02_FULL_46_47]OGL75200.1 MAG: hypothetical protein A3F52_04120 [Candidatus Uhrbacteria bacterium RIFCSPHIGHO2_12_FULL_47_11]OGL80115.1 MAG: hypothetical protein A3B21_01935 [Candidatus Uhrbacteria bacterium RIFCSPLOWO2_01_FULL_47_24]